MGDSNSVVAEYVSEEKWEEIRQDKIKKDFEIADNFRRILRNNNFEIRKGNEVELFHLEVYIPPAIMKKYNDPPIYWVFNYRHCKEIILVRYLCSWINNKKNFKKN